jgi:hypothetical protein
MDELPIPREKAIANPDVIWYKLTNQKGGCSTVFESAKQ